MIFFFLDRADKKMNGVLYKTVTSRAKRTERDKIYNTTLQRGSPNHICSLLARATVGSKLWSVTVTNALKEVSV